VAVIGLNRKREGEIEPALRTICREALHAQLAWIWRLQLKQRIKLALNELLRLGFGVGPKERMLGVNDQLSELVGIDQLALGALESGEAKRGLGREIRMIAGNRLRQQLVPAGTPIRGLLETRFSKADEKVYSQGILCIAKSDLPRANCPQQMATFPLDSTESIAGDCSEAVVWAVTGDGAVGANRLIQLVQCHPASR